MKIHLHPSELEMLMSAAESQAMNIYSLKHKSVEACNYAKELVEIVREVRHQMEN